MTQSAQLTSELLEVSTKDQKKAMAAETILIGLTK